jgi:type 1 glutamine amidotransferase
MRTTTLIIAALLLTAWFPIQTGGEEKAMPENDKIRVLVVTGGHDFEREPFFALFQGYDDITYQAVEHPKAHDLFKPDAANQYDVLVLYDMWQDISDEAKANFVNLLQQGKGLVALHHCLASYQSWDEYAKAIGGKFYLQKQVEGGVEKPASTFQHGVRFTVHVADPNHPVTSGVKDFEIVDETYGHFEVLPQVKPLLTTDEPSSGKTIGWTNTYGQSRVVYLELGHDHTAYENPNFRQLVAQAIRWTAGKAE